MTDTQNNEELNKAICSLYRTLSAVQFAAIKYVHDGAGEQERTTRAQEITSALTKGINGSQRLPMLLLLNDDEKCWDPVTQTYVNC